MLSRISPFWGAIISSLLYSFIQSGRRRSDAIGWDLADLFIALLVAGAFLYKATGYWRAGHQGKTALCGAVSAFMFWMSWDTLRMLHIL